MAHGTPSTCPEPARDAAPGPLIALMGSARGDRGQRRGKLLDRLCDELVRSGTHSVRHQCLSRCNEQDNPAHS